MVDSQDLRYAKNLLLDHKFSNYVHQDVVIGWEKGKTCKLPSQFICFLFSEFLFLSILIFTLFSHKGPVQALDLNPFKTSLLASGASDSEIYIWDLANPSNPLTPGSKTLPPDNISCVAWNRQVQHILASASPCGRCVVWDLRKNEPIIKVSDQSATVRPDQIQKKVKLHLPYKVLKSHTLLLDPRTENLHCRTTCTKLHVSS